VNPDTILILACLLGSIIGWLSWLIVPRCERCWRPGRAGRCPVCGKWLCRECKPREGLCPGCWETQDGLKEDALAELYADRLRLEIQHGERGPSGVRIKDGEI